MLFETKIVLKAPSSIILVCALETFLSVLLSSLIHKAVKRQRRQGSFLMTLLRLLYVVYIETPIHTFYLAWVSNTMAHSRVCMFLSPSVFYFCCFSSQYVVGSGRSVRWEISGLSFSFLVLPVAILCIFFYLCCDTETSKTAFFWWVCCQLQTQYQSTVPNERSSWGSSQIAIAKNKMSHAGFSFFTLSIDVPRIIFPWIDCRKRIISLTS